MNRFIVTAAALAAAGPACAQSVKLTPLIDARARYEHVEQDGLARQSDAVTVRVRAGVEAKRGGLSALVETQGTLAVVGDYYNGLKGATDRPLVADPQNVALYRAQLRYADKHVALTAGRQRIALDDERFVGAVNFRDNGQTFDAVRAEIMPAKGLKADVTYAWAQRTIWGIDGNGARPPSVSGDNVLANLGYRTRLGTLTGFAYLVDQNDAAVQGFRLSSQTYGGRVAGTHPFSKKVKLTYQFSYARQSNYYRNPNVYRADYYLADAGLDLSRFKLGAGYEVLGADSGKALTSFQTPLATGFKFQGWVNKFLTTPPDGVRDLYASAGYGLKSRAIGAVTFQAIYHRFVSDRLVRRYGDEIDLLASTKVKRTTLSVRYGDYRAHGYLTNTRKFWLQADWAL